MWGVFERVWKFVYVSAKSAYEEVLAASRGSVASMLPVVLVEGRHARVKCSARSGACILLLDMHTQQLNTPHLYRCATFTKRRHISTGM